MLDGVPINISPDKCINKDESSLYSMTIDFAEKSQYEGFEQHSDVASDSSFGLKFIESMTSKYRGGIKLNED